MKADTVQTRGAEGAASRMVEGSLLNQVCFAAPLLLLTGGLAVHQTGSLRILLPAVLFCSSCILFMRSRSQYFGLVWLVWFLTPCVRRLVDYSAGWLDPSPILLAPYLVTLVAPLAGAAALLRAPIPAVLPFLLCLLAIAGGFLSGFFRYPLGSVVHDLLNWSTPPLFAAYLMLVQGEAARFRRAAHRWLPWLLGAAALYTVLQFCLAFPWDTEWLVNMDTPSMGAPEAFAMRAFGTLNSAGTAAYTFAMGAVYLLGRRPAFWRIPLLLLIAAAIITTQVRAGWLAVAIGAVLSLVRMPRRAGAGLGMLAVLGLAVSAVGLGAHADILSDRFQSLTTPSDDSSANGRLEGYGAAAAFIAQAPLGGGFGVPDDILDIQGSFSLFDSSPVDVFMTFGVLGIAYYLGLFGIVWRAAGSLRRHDPENDALTLPAFALLGVALLGSVTVALTGFLAWTLLASAPADSAAQEGADLPVKTSTAALEASR